MGNESTPKTPDSIYSLTADTLHPDYLSALFTLNPPSPKDLVRVGELLDFFNKRQTNPSTREAILDSALALFTHEISDYRFEDNTSVSEGLLPIIMQNQTTRELQPIWELMLEQSTNGSGDPIMDKYLKEGSSMYGLLGMALMPDFNGDCSKPPIDVLPEAFVQMVNNAREGDISNKIPLFLRQFRSFYSDSDTNNLIEILETESDLSLPLWAFEEIMSYRKKILYESQVSAL